MKKAGIAIMIFGLIITIIGCIVKSMEEKSITIIGGADGPTSVFLAGKVGYGSGMVEIIVGLVIIIIIGFIIVWKKCR